jgi:hypothetical protein
LLKGGVKTDIQKATSQPGLRRQDLDNNTDPFAGAEENALDAPTSAFKADAPKRAQKPLKGNLNDTGGGNPYKGQFEPAKVAPENMPIDGEGDNMPPPQQPQQPMQMSTPFTPQDPEEAGDMKLLWDIWHRHVAETIFQRFNFFAKAAFKHSPPLLANVTYVVTRDGRITNMNMQQKSSNVLFNVLVYQSIKSLDGDLSVLAFPQGSRRQFVNQSGNFTQNYGGEGFRFMKNDQESLGKMPQAQRQMPQQMQQMMPMQMPMQGFPGR